MLRLFTFKFYLNVKMVYRKNYTEKKNRFFSVDYVELNELLAVHT